MGLRMGLRQESRKISELCIQCRHGVRRWDDGRKGRRWRGASGWNELWLINVYIVLVVSYFDSRLCFSLWPTSRAFLVITWNMPGSFHHRVSVVGVTVPGMANDSSIQVSVCRFHSKPFIDYLSAHSTFYNVILILILFFALLISNDFLICWCILSLLSLNFILCVNRDLVSCSALPVFTHSFGQYLLFIGHL